MLVLLNGGILEAVKPLLARTLHSLMLVLLNGGVDCRACGGSF